MGNNLSKPFERFPYETFRTERRLGEGMVCKVPLHMLKTLELPGRRRVPPKCDWQTYAEQKGIILVDCAGVLLYRTTVLPTEACQALEDMGYDRRVITYWICEEECNEFDRVLKACADQLSLIQQIPRRDHKARAGNAVLNVFIETISSTRSRDRSGFVCWNCHEGERGFTCSGCRYARYCSTWCQKADWVHHKPFCEEGYRPFDER